jgi:ribosomal protein S18 acetylase RimI-like enzyme
VTELTVRLLDEAEWETYRRIRLASLESDPDSFAAGLDEEQEYDEELWRTRMRRSRRLIAERGDDEVGVASVGQARDEDGQAEGVAELFGMWVRPQDRGTSVASDLVTAAAGQARRDGYRQLRLWVSTDNGRAIGFYSGYGFRPGDERRPMVTDESVEEVAMVMPLSS